SRGVAEAARALGRAGGPSGRLATLRRAVEVGLAAARRDRALLDAVAVVRTSKQDLGVVGADVAYARAFREAGLDVDGSPPARIGAVLRARPPTVALALAAALDDRALVRQFRSKSASWRRPLEVAR